MRDRIYYSRGSINSIHRISDNEWNELTVRVISDFKSDISISLDSMLKVCKYIIENNKNSWWDMLDIFWWDAPLD